MKEFVFAMKNDKIVISGNFVSVSSGNVAIDKAELTVDIGEGERLQQW